VLATGNKNGNTPALEELGVWLQVAALRSRGKQEAPTVGSSFEELPEPGNFLGQEPDGYLGVYPPADRLGASARSVDEYWGLAELGRGLLELAEQGDESADRVARRLGGLLITVKPEQLDRDPGQQHPAAAAVLYFLTGMARRTGDPAYRQYLGRAPGRIGLPNEKSPFPPVLPPVLREWGKDQQRAARGVASLSGILALGRYEEYGLLVDAVRERWSELRRTFPQDAGPDLLARWVRLTVDLRGEGDQEELRRELKRVARLRLGDHPPYTTLIRLLRKRASEEHR
jgi:hypothetical protein